MLDHVGPAAAIDQHSIDPAGRRPRILAMAENHLPGQRQPPGCLKLCHLKISFHNRQISDRIRPHDPCSREGLFQRISDKPHAVAVLSIFPHHVRGGEQVAISSQRSCEPERNLQALSFLCIQLNRYRPSGHSLHCCDVNTCHDDDRSIIDKALQPCHIQSGFACPPQRLLLNPPGRLTWRNARD